MRSEAVSTIYLEPKALYNSKQAMTPVPEDFEFHLELQKVRRTGSDLTVVTYGNTTPFASRPEEIENETG